MTKRSITEYFCMICRIIIYKFIKIVKFRIKKNIRLSKKNKN